MLEKFSTKPDIINQYLLLIFEIITVKLTYLNYKRKVENVFGNNERILNILKKETDEYLESLYNEIKVLKFMYKNEKKLYTSNIYKVRNDFDKKYEKRYFYLESLYANLQTALEMKWDSKFYVPRNKPKYLNEEDVEKYITYIKGFNFDIVKEFLIDEEIYDEQGLEETLQKTKILNVDAKENIEMFGIYDKGVIIPKAKDALSCLISVHELVHQALLTKKDELEDEITFGEDLPKFYELLFKARNTYITEECNESSVALELFEDYNEESFEEQINKLSRLKNSTR